MSPFDAAVVGRGAIGSAAALAFARAGWRVALVGPGPEVGSPDPLIEGALPWDSRVYALSPASRQLLQDLEIHEATLRRNCEQLVDWFMAEVAQVEA